MPHHLPAPQLFLDARLFSRRSLSPTASHLLVLITGLMSCAVGIPFAIAGAWPVAAFAGLNTLLLFVAFRKNFQAAAAYETIALSSHELLVAKIDSLGHKREWRFHPRWVRVEQQADPDFGVLSLKLLTHKHGVEIATCLGPSEKAEFAKVLAFSISEARKGPRFA